MTSYNERRVLSSYTKTIEAKVGYQPYVTKDTETIIAQTIIITLRNFI